MSIYVVNIAIPSGSDFSQSFFLEDANSNSALDLTNYNAYSMMKKSPLSINATTSFSVEIAQPTTSGKIIISLGSSITSTLKPGRYSYDVLLKHQNTNKKTRVVEGSALVLAGITTA